MIKEYEQHYKGVLNSAEIEIDICFPVAITKLQQVFFNENNEIIEAIYQIPVPAEVTLNELELFFDNEKYIGKLLRSDAAEISYEKGIQEGKRSVLLQDKGNGILELNLGNLPPAEKVEVSITITHQLYQIGNDIKYVLPTIISPRYGKFEISELSSPFIDALSVYPFKATVNVHGLSFNVVNSSHDLQKKRDKVFFSGYLDRDIFIQFVTDEMDQDALSFEYNDLTFTIATINQLNHELAQDPNASGINDKGNPKHIHCVVDCSGSMQGTAIDKTRDGLLSLLRNLGEDDYFNLIRFGSTI